MLVWRSNTEMEGEFGGDVGWEERLGADPIAPHQKIQISTLFGGALEASRMQFRPRDSWVLFRIPYS